MFLGASLILPAQDFVSQSEEVTGKLLGPGNQVRRGHVLLNYLQRFVPGLLRLIAGCVVYQCFNSTIRKMPHQSITSGDDVLVLAVCAAGGCRPFIVRGM